MTGSGLEILPDVRVVHPDVREVARMSGGGQEALPDVKEWSRDLPG